MRRFVAALMTGLLAGCGAGPVQGRATYDLQCPESQLRVVAVSKGVRLVEGCGQRATYVESCNTKAQGTIDCHWVLNSKEEPEIAEQARAQESGQGGATNTSPLPDAALGYAFDMSSSQARSACEEGGHIWEIEGQYYTCSGTPIDGGFPFRARLGFCANTLCELVLVADLESDFPRFDEKFQVLSTAMTSKYGRRQRVEGKMASGCESSAVTCAATSHGQRTSLWLWPDGQNLEMDLRGGQSRARLAIRYYLLIEGMSLDAPSEGAGSILLDTSAY